MPTPYYLVAGTGFGGVSIRCCQSRTGRSHGRNDGIEWWKWLFTYSTSAIDINGINSSGYRSIQHRSPHIIDTNRGVSVLSILDEQAEQRIDN